MNKLLSKRHNQASGFTIIEVVLVLAIAGLIFLMVFIALPALQRGQRDTQRKNDLSRVNTQVQNFVSASRGSIPTTTGSSATFSTFVQKYLGGDSSNCASSEYQDPNKTDATACTGTNTGYHLIPGTGATTVGDGDIVYTTGVLCATDGSGGTTSSGASARSYGLQIKLENQQVPYCVDNH
jgi:prepilin-type N-terminal cleavage/methylation domain-containing protein